MNEFERFMAERFPDSIDRRRCLNGDGSDYMSWDMNVARVVWNHLQQKLDAVTAENVALKVTLEAVRGVATNSQGIVGWHLNGEIAGWDEILPEINDAETPATDAIINALRAEGINEFCGLLEKYGKVEPHNFNPLFADLYAKISKRIYDSILNNPCVYDLASLVDWLERGADDSRAYADMAIKHAAQLRNGEHVGEEGA